MKAKILLQTFILLFFVISGLSQDNTNPSSPTIKKNAISFSILGATPLLGFTYERLIHPKLSLDLGLGFPSVSAGAKIYPFTAKAGKFNPTIGYNFIFFTDPLEVGNKQLHNYLPIGVNYIGKRRLNLALDAGPKMVSQNHWTSSDIKYEGIYIYAGFKIGVRF